MQIAEAEKELKLKFPKEFVDYVKEYGVISFYGTESTGVLNSKSYLNVVKSTMWERENDDKFPKDCFLLENLGIDGLLAICDEEGKVYSYSKYGKKELWANSISEYLDICIARKNQR